MTAAETFFKGKLNASAHDPHKLHTVVSSLLSLPPLPSLSFLTAEDFATSFDEKIGKKYLLPLFLHVSLIRFSSPST